MNAARKGLNQLAGEHRPQLRQRVPDEEQLQERRRRAEDPVVEEHEARAPTRKRLLRPSARKKPITHATASETSVNSRARSAPFQYGLELSASQKMWVSKLASTRARDLLHVRDRDLMLGCDLLQRAVLLQCLDRGAERGAHLLVRRAVIDPERVRLREQVGERELARMGCSLICTRGVLGQDGIGASDQELRNGIRVTRIALQRELRPARRLELVVRAL